MIELPLTKGKPAFGRVLGVQSMDNTRWYQIQILQPVQTIKLFPVEIIDEEAILARPATKVLWSQPDEV